MGTVGILGSWALQEYIEYLVVGHFRHTWWLGTAGILSGWALQGYSVLERCMDTLPLGSVGILGGWALQGYFAVGTARILCGWVQQGYLAGILCGGALHEYSRQQARTTWTLKSNNPTVRVGKKT